MNKVGIAAAVGVVALGAAYVGVSWFTGNVYDEQLQFQLQKFESATGRQSTVATHQWRPLGTGMACCS